MGQLVTVTCFMSSKLWKKGGNECYKGNLYDIDDQLPMS